MNRYEELERRVRALERREAVDGPDSLDLYLTTAANVRADRYAKAARGLATEASTARTEAAGLRRRVDELEAELERAEAALARVAEVVRARST